jgi:hypothetical protein
MHLRNSTRMSKREFQTGTKSTMQCHQQQRLPTCRNRLFLQDVYVYACSLLTSLPGPLPPPRTSGTARAGFARATLYSVYSIYYSSHSLSNARVGRMEVTKRKRSAVKASLHLVFVYRVRHNSSHSCGDVPEGALPRQDQQLMTTTRKHPPISCYLFIEPS